MNDFFKIFLVLSLMVGSFFVGKNYGEKTYFDSNEYKKFGTLQEEMNATKSDLENAKVKLQNIIDRGDKERTEQLLADILEVFLLDLGLRVQNREAILRQSQNLPVATTSISVANTIPPNPEPPSQPVVTEVATNIQNKEDRNFEKFLRQLKSKEWILMNSDGNKNQLDKVVIKDLQTFLKAYTLEYSNCGEYLGEFRGDLNDVGGGKQGSVIFELKSVQSGTGSLYDGKISILSDPNLKLLINIKDHCGLVVNGSQGRFFDLRENRFLQIYPIINNKLAGNFYEILPAGTTKRIGSFRLKRVDKF